MKKIIALTLALIMSLSCFSLISFAEETETKEHLTEVPEGYVGVYTIEDLYCVRNDLTANYILMNDIDLSEATAEGGDWNYGGRGWNPIGSNDVYSNNAFSGVFDGNCYSITGMNINITTYLSDNLEKYIGFFSYLTGTIKNLNIEGRIVINCSVYAPGIGDLDTYIGSIAAYSSGTISNCTSNVVINSYVNSVAGSGKYGSYVSNCYVGGIVGRNIGTIEKCGNYADIDTTYKSKYASKNFTGGIAGDSYAGNIYRCVNSGKISGVSKGYTVTSSSYWFYVYVTGIAYEGTINNCYNAGAITVKGSDYRYAGGISWEGDAKYCYNVGLVTSDYGITSYKAINSSGDNTKCYYLEGTGTSSTGATSLTEAQMKLQSMYSGWDFDTVWTMDGREDYPYPELRDVPLVLPEDLNHKHEYTSEVTKEATHLEEGETTYTCECGDSYTEAIAKLEGHTYTSEVTKEATHLEEGVTTYTCACGDSYTEAIAKLEGHTYTSEVTKEATHLEEGETTYTCACGDSYTESIAKLEGHTYKAVVTEPTCTAKGYTTYTCECGDSYVSDYVAVSQHSYSSTVSRPATHLSEGIRTYTCTVCGDSYTEAIAKTKEHSYFVLKIVEPACDSEGYTTYMCECGHTYNGDKKAATGHNYKGDYCEDCGESKTGNCSCNCHKKGFMSFIWKIINFFNKLFKNNKTCACGIAHY